MKVWTLTGAGTGLEKLKLRTDLKNPSPGHGQVLVRVHAASPNFRDLGADELINYKQVPDWHLRELELTGGFGVDYTIEVGGKDTLVKTTMATRVAGQVNVIGLLSGMPEVGQDVLLCTLSPW